MDTRGRWSRCRRSRRKRRENAAINQETKETVGSGGNEVDVDGKDVDGVMKDERAHR